MESSPDRCVHCEHATDPAALLKCPMCFKLVCEEHQHKMSGRAFCGERCAEYYFFADPDDDSGGEG